MPEWNWLWHAEIEPFPLAVMAARHPHSFNLGDVTAPDFVARARAIGVPDVLVFGSPCQSFSVAGKRLGLDDPRGNLALIALRIVRELGVPWFCFENVPGLFSSWSGDSDNGEQTSDFAGFLHAVGDIGYGGAWSVLDAQFFGLAQRRKRVFFVGRAGADWRGPAAVLLESDRLCGDSPTRGAAGQDVTGTLASRTRSGGGYGPETECPVIPVEAFGGGNTAGAIEVATTITTKCGQRQDFEADTFIMAHTLRGDGFDASEDGTGRGTPLVPVVANTLCSGGKGARGFINSPDHTFVPMAFHENQRAEVTLNESTGALNSGGGKPGQGYPAVLAHGVRRLMPVECERLQGFKDGHSAITYRGKPAADGPRYRAVGNSMAVPVVRWILERIQQVDNIQLQDRIAPPCRQVSDTQSVLTNDVPARVLKVS